MVIRDPFGRWHSLLQLVLRLMRAARYSAGSANQILVGLHANTLSDSLSPSPYLARWRFYFCRRQRTQYAIFVACTGRCLYRSLSLLVIVVTVACCPAIRVPVDSKDMARELDVLHDFASIPRLGERNHCSRRINGFFAGFWSISSPAYLTSAMATPTLDTAEVTRFQQGANPIIAPRVL